MADEILEDEENSKKGKSSLMPIVILLAVVILAELGFVLYIISSVKGASEDTPKDMAPKENVVKVDSSLISIAYSDPIDILVNIKGTDGDRYFKAEFVIVYDAGTYPLLGDYLGSQMPRFKDIAINIFSNQDMNVLDNSKLRDKYLGQLIGDVKKFIPSDKGEIKNILINEWLIQ